jgi:hypothetical protein
MAMCQPGIKLTETSLCENNIVRFMGNLTQNFSRLIM